MAHFDSLKIIRNDEVTEFYDMCTRVRVYKGELIRLTTATGGGFGDPRRRRRDLVERDIRSGFVTLDQAARIYGVIAGD